MQATATYEGTIDASQLDSLQAGRKYSIQISSGSDASTGNPTWWNGVKWWCYGSKEDFNVQNLPPSESDPVLLSTSKTSQRIIRPVTQFTAAESIPTPPNIKVDFELSHATTNLSDSNSNEEVFITVTSTLQGDARISAMAFSHQNPCASVLDPNFGLDSFIVHNNMTGTDLPQPYACVLTASGPMENRKNQFIRMNPGEPIVNKYIISINQKGGSDIKEDM